MTENSLNFKIRRQLTSVEQSLPLWLLHHLATVVYHANLKFRLLTKLQLNARDGPVLCVWEACHLHMLNTWSPPGWRCLELELQSPQANFREVAERRLKLRCTANGFQDVGIVVVPPSDRDFAATFDPAIEPVVSTR